LDFLGFGGSDRYPEMSESCEGIPALGRADAASRQIEKAVDFILKRHGVERLSLIAHSWGSMPGGLFAGRYPEQTDRIVFFAPIAQRPQQVSATKFPGWRLVPLEEQWDRFVEDVPRGNTAVLSKRHFEEWGSLYLDTDEVSRTHSPASVKTPTGPVQEIAEALAGQLAYDPGLIKAPTAIIRGEWDHLVTDDDARWFFGALKNSPIKRDIKISHATHLMHLEHHRYALSRPIALPHRFCSGCDHWCPQILRRRRNCKIGIEKTRRRVGASGAATHHAVVGTLCEGWSVVVTQAKRVVGPVPYSKTARADYASKSEE
jgi:pimeloyl-ACP methyl ester carboxylesterase